MKFRPIAGRLPKYKRFDYEPRYYKPEKEHQDHRIKFEPVRRRQNKQLKSVLFYASLLFLILYLIVRLG